MCRTSAADEAGPGPHPRPGPARADGNRGAHFSPLKAVPQASSAASAVPAAALPSGALNILVLGSDSRSGEENRRLGGGDSEGARSDTALVVHVDESRRTATVVRIPRDTPVTRPYEEPAASRLWASLR